MYAYKARLILQPGDYDRELERNFETQFHLCLYNGMHCWRSDWFFADIFDGDGDVTDFLADVCAFQKTSGPILVEFADATVEEQRTGAITQ